MNAAQKAPEITYIGDLDDSGTPKPFTVVAPDGLHKSAIAQLEEADGIELIESQFDDTTKMPQVLSADAYILRSKSKPNTPEKIAEFVRASIIARIGVGTGNIDKVAAAHNGITVLNTPGASTAPVARRAMMFIEMWAARMNENRQANLNRDWRKKELTPRDLSEMTLGIVGWGRIGSDLVRRAETDDMFQDVVYCDIDPGKKGTIPLEELLAQADVVSIHADTENQFIGEKELALMKDDALIVNTARAVIQQEPLLKAMDEKGISYATDVYWNENVEGMRDPRTSTITTHPNFYGTQHTGASDPGTQAKLGREGARCIVEFAQEGKIRAENCTLPIFPEMDPGPRQTPGARLFLAHESVPGQLEKITREIADAKISIQDCLNREGKQDNGNRLGMTIVDLPQNIDPQTAVAVMKKIDATLQPLRKRILWFTEQ